jgi:phosphoserine aminotransferase
MKKHNFNAGPSILPRVAIENTAKAILDFNGIGMSILEISHRSKDFQAVIDEAVSLFKEIMNIPEGYQVLFLGGGASLQFCMIPFNLLNKKQPILKQVFGQRKLTRKQNSLVK